MTDWCDIHTQADKNLTQQAEAVFNRLGMTMQEAITRFLQEVAEHDTLPFQQDPDDMSHPRHPRFEEWEHELNHKIEEAEKSLAAGRFVTPEQLKANMEKLIASYTNA